MAMSPVAANTAATQFGADLLRDLNTTLIDLVLNPDAQVGERAREAFTGARNAGVALIEATRSPDKRMYALSDAGVEDTLRRIDHSLMLLVQLHGPQAHP